MKRRAVIENAVGETRAAIYEGRRLVELHVDRPWQTIPRTGDVYIGRVTSVDPSVAGAWVEIGGDALPALLPFAAQRDMPKLAEGQSVEVSILRSQIGGKGATLRYQGESESKPQLIKKLSLPERLLERFPGITFDEASVNAVDSACETSLALPGGGSITIEQTQALLAVDVDKGTAISAAAAANEAAKLTASQLRLRGLGGLVIVDFPNLRQPKQRKTLERTFEDACGADPNVTKFNALSRFGVIEMTRSKPDLSLDEILNTKVGEPTLTTQAIRALRRLTREAAVSAGAQLELIVTPDIESWLKDAPFDWQTEVAERIGARFKLISGSAVDVKADR
ncbi:MAG: ribonuclease E/G [Litorimonas sp.]